MELVAGQKIPLATVLADAAHFSIRITSAANAQVDVACFGLGAGLQLVGDAYMTFYNQPQTPHAEVAYRRDGQQDGFEFDLSRITTTELQRFVICATTDGATSALAMAAPMQVEVVDAGKVVLVYTLQAADFADLKAIKLVDVYWHQQGWRLGANGQGFNGGLPALVCHFGGEVAEVETETATAAPSAWDVRKKLVLDKIEKSQPKLLDLAKKSLISLEKKQLLGVTARVGLVLDRSGSMSKQYKCGDVQQVIDRVAPLALNFDDNGAFECWAFGEKSCQLDDVALTNVAGYIDTCMGGWKKWPIGAAFNNEPAAIEQATQYYAQFNDGIPTYIVFVSDGGVSESRKITKLITEAAKLPIFWQFVGIGGRDYGILKKLDTLENRVIDNCNFFDLDHINQVSDGDLYDLLLQEFPIWLAQAKQKGMVG